MDSLPYSNAIGFCSTAICKTEAPSYLSVLLKQRRRWLLGKIFVNFFKNININMFIHIYKYHFYNIYYPCLIIFIIFIIFI